MFDYQAGRCDKCGGFCMPNWAYCPQCGAKIEQKPLKKKKCPMCQGSGEVIDWGGNGLMPFNNQEMLNDKDK